MTRVSRVLPGLSLAVVLCLGAGCAAHDRTGPDGPPPSTAPSAAGPSGATVPPGVQLTEPGSELGLGEPATVAWQPGPEHSAVVSLAVDAVVAARRSDLRGWDLDAEARAAAPHYVHVEAVNVGDTDVGGVALPLYAVAAGGGLVPASTFGAEFEPCPSGPLPVPVAPGEATTVCLVYLVPDGGRVESVEFRPTADTAPISWTGEVRRARR